MYNDKHEHVGRLAQHPKCSARPKLTQKLHTSAQLGAMLMQPVDAALYVAPRTHRRVPRASVTSTTLDRASAAAPVALSAAPRASASWALRVTFWLVRAAVSRCKASTRAPAVTCGGHAMDSQQEMDQNNLSKPAVRVASTKNGAHSVQTIEHATSRGCIQVVISAQARSWFSGTSKDNPSPRTL